MLSIWLAVGVAIALVVLLGVTRLVIAIALCLLIYLGHFPPLANLLLGVIAFGLLFSH